MLTTLAGTAFAAYAVGRVRPLRRARRFTARRALYTYSPSHRVMVPYLILHPYVFAVAVGRTWGILPTPQRPEPNPLITDDEVLTRED